MRKTRVLILATLILASLCVDRPTAAGKSAGKSITGSTDDLAAYIGSWQTEYQDAEGDNKQIWTMKWNEKKTFLDFRTLTFLNNEVIFVGVGFIFYSEPESEYRMYLMMDNGALHESIGEKTGRNDFRFTTKTWGNAAFGDMDTEVSLSTDEMLVTYVYEGKDGTLKRSEEVFTRVDK